jgi:hypothetical protein
MKKEKGDIGRTPAFLKNVKPGIHRLRVKDSETEIYHEPGGTLQINLSKIASHVKPFCA